MNSNSSNDTKFNARMFVGPLPTPPIIQPNLQAQIAPTFCTICGSGLLLLEKAARLCQRSPRILYRWIEQESLHFRELVDGSVMICGQSLAEHLGALESNSDRSMGNEDRTLSLDRPRTESATEELPGWLSSPQIYATNTDH